MHGEAKKLDFLKNRPQKSGLKALKNSIFEGGFTFQVVLKTLLCIHYSGLQGSDIKPSFLLTKSVFLGYLLIGTSYDSDFCMGVKI